MELKESGSESIKQNMAQVKVYFAGHSSELVTQRQTLDIWVLFGK